MKPVSTGIGLIVLSATIAACFAASRFGGEERAFAEPSVPSSPASGGSMLAIGNCEGEPVTWLNPMPRIIPVCESLRAAGCELMWIADVNDDGMHESFSVNFNQLCTLIADGQPTNPQEHFRLYLTERRNESLGTTVTGRKVMDTEIALPNIVAAFPNQIYLQLAAYIGRSGWADMDGDQDLDLVLWYSRQWVSGGTRQTEEGQIWFENTGFQKSPAPNPYDHDGDGHVNTSDLSLLLMEFTD